LVAARGHALLGKSLGGPSSGPQSVFALTPDVSLGQVAIASPAQGWPRASRDCFLAQRWLRASRDFFSRPRLVSGEVKQCRPSRDGFRRVVVASPARSWTQARQSSVAPPVRGWPWASQNYVSRLRLALGETKLCLPPTAGLGGVRTVSPTQSWPRARHNCLLSDIGLGRDRTESPVRGRHRARQNYVSHPELASSETELRLPSEVGLGRDETVSLAQSWPRARQNCISRPRLASGETKLRLSPRGWPRARQNCISHPRLASDKTELRLPSEVGLERDGTASPAQSWPRARRNYITRPRLASGETELCLPPRAGLRRDEIASPVRGWPRTRRNSVSRPRLASAEKEQCFCARKTRGISISHMPRLFAFGFDASALALLLLRATQPYRQHRRLVPTCF
jgi:hypothetical protein